MRFVLLLALAATLSGCAAQRAPFSQPGVNAGRGGSPYECMTEEQPGRFRPCGSDVQ